MLIINLYFASSCFFNEWVNLTVCSVLVWQAFIWKPNAAISDFSMELSLLTSVHPILFAAQLPTICTVGKVRNYSLGREDLNARHHDMGSTTILAWILCSSIFHWKWACFCSMYAIIWALKVFTIVVGSRLKLKLYCQVLKNLSDHIILGFGYCLQLL